MHSAAQSRKLLRNPCTVARPASPVVLSSFVSVMSDISLPFRNDEGKTRPESSPESSSSSRARASTASAGSDIGTRCSAPAFMRLAGMRHSFALKSISLQVAPRASQLRAAVRIRNRKHSFAAIDAPVASIVSSAAVTVATRIRGGFHGRRSELSRSFPTQFPTLNLGSYGNRTELASP